MKKELQIGSQMSRASFRTIVFMAALLSVAPSLRSQTRNISFEHFSVKQGMTGGSVPCIYQDHFGYLWFGTFFGVDRYDGYGFTSYRHDPENPASLVNAFVQTLSEDKQGDIWVGSSRGLDRLDRATGEFTHYLPHSPSTGTERSNSVLSIYEDKDGLLWIGTDDGLNVLDRTSGKFRCLRDDSTDSGTIGYNSIRPIYEDRAGSLWVGTGRGLSRIDKRSGKFIHFWHDFKNMDRSANWIFSIYEDDSGMLWLGGNAGLVSFDPRTGTFTQYGHDPDDPGSLISNDVSSVSGDRDGQLWVGTWLHGLNVFDKKSKSFTHYVHNTKDPGSLSSNSVMCVYCERSGTIWVSTVDGGVNKLNRAKPLFTTYLYEDFNPYSVFPHVLSDNAGKLWTHDANEWKKFDPTTETFINQSLGKGYYPLLVDRLGNLWLGNESGGLYKRNPLGRLTSFHDPSKVGFRRVVNCFIEGHDGRYWLGTIDGGFLTLDVVTNSVKLIRQVADQINTIYEDSFGLLWVGSWDNGLLCYDPLRKTTARFTSDPQNGASLSGNTVGAIHEDNAGILWIGTIMGLNRYDRTSGTFTHLTIKDGLSNNAVSEILEDNHGNLWLGTLNGLSKFCATGASASDGDPKKIRFRNYDISYGLADNAVRGACRIKNGEMFLCGQNGLTRFHPDSIRDNPYVPPIVVTQFRLYEKPTPFSNGVNLSYRDNFISFEFAALSFICPERNQYAYKMEGIDPDWVNSGTRRYAGYPHLEPGEYVFRVKGSNNDGVWNEAGTSIVVRITPPFWATWWFRTFIWLTVAGSIFGTIRYIEIAKLRKRMRMLEQQQGLEHERLRISNDLHDELASNLSSIAMLGKILEEKTRPDKEISDDQPQIMKRIVNLSEESVDSIRDIIWAIDPKSETLENLFTRLRDMMIVTCRARNIRWRFDHSSAESLPTANLAPETRSDLWLLLKEAVNNVLKHSSCTELSLRVRYAEGTLTVTVQDNGSGFDQSTVKAGRGLRTMRTRAEHMGGTLVHESKQGVGTVVEFVVRV